MTAIAYVILSYPGSRKGRTVAVSDKPSSVADLSDQELVGLLAGKIDSLSAQVTSLLPKMENFIGVAVAILVGSVTLGVTQKHPIILVLLPFPLVVLFAYLLQSNTEMLSRAGHKWFLEEAVNEMLQRPVLLEERYVAKSTLHGKGRFGQFGRPSVIMVQSFMVLLLCGAIALAITRLEAVKTTVGLTVFWASLGAGVALLVAAAIEQMGAYHGGYDAAKAAFERSPEPLAAQGGDNVPAHGS